jgi:formyl-CoA transferase
VGILACLRARERSGHGYTIDLSLLDCAIASQVNIPQAYLSSGQLPPRQGNAHLQIVPYQLFQTADGWLVLNVGNDGQWQQFGSAADRPDLAADERFTTNAQRVRNREELIPLIEELMRSRTTADWQERLRSKNVPHALVLNHAELFEQEQVAARNMKITVRDPHGQPVDLVGTPFHIGGLPPASASMPPTLGEHSTEILQQILKMGPDRISELRQLKVV